MAENTKIVRFVINAQKTAKGKYFRPVRFPAQDIFASDRASNVLTPEQVANVLDRHQAGDWGDVSDASFWANEFSREHDLLLSRFHTRQGQAVWVVTNPRQKSTKVLLDEDLADPTVLG